MIGYRRRRFVIATAAAGAIWAAYSFFIGRLGGRAFEDKPWAGLLVAFGITIAVSGLIEAIRADQIPVSRSGAEACAVRGSDRRTRSPRRGRRG